jgi:hypothetical protein
MVGIAVARHGRSELHGGCDKTEMLAGTVVVQAGRLTVGLNERLGRCRREWRLRAADQVFFRQPQTCKPLARDTDMLRLAAV